MEKDTLLRIKKRLEELHTQWYIASIWKDKRSRHRKICEASVAISNYADTLPPEILGLFDIEVARGALIGVGATFGVIQKQKKVQAMDEEYEKGLDEKINELSNK